MIVYGVRGVGLRTVEQLHAAEVAVVVVEAGPEDADPVAERLLTAWGRGTPPAPGRQARPARPGSRSTAGRRGCAHCCAPWWTRRTAS